MSTQGAGPAIEKTSWSLVILLGFLSAYAALSIDLYLPSLPSIGSALHANPAQVQATLGVFMAGLAIGQLVYGPASDRLGRRPMVLVGAAIYVAASIICALAPRIEVLIAGRFVQALGGGAGVVASRAVVRDLFSDVETARMLSLMTLFMGLAPVLAPSLGGLLVTLAGWRAAFWALAALGTAIGLFAFVRLRESRSAATAAQARLENPLRSYLAVFRQRQLVGFLLAGALNGAAFFTYLACSPGLIIGIYKIPPAHFGWVFSLNAVGLIAASQLNRWVLRRRTIDQVLRAASLATAVFGALLALAAFTGFGERWTVLPLLFLIVATYGFIHSNTAAGALKVDPLRAGSISALSGAAGFAAGGAASVLAGALYDGTPRPMALIMCLGLIASAAALRLLALQRQV